MKTETRVSKVYDKMAEMFHNVTDAALLTKLYHICPALAVKCALQGDVDGMLTFEKLTCAARTRVAELYGGFDEGHLHFYRSFRNQMGDLRNHVKNLDGFKFTDDRIVSEVLSHNIPIPDSMLPKPRSWYQLRRVAQPAHEKMVVDMLEKFFSEDTDQVPATSEREGVKTATVFKPALSKSRRQARLEKTRDNSRRTAVSRSRGL